MKFITSITNKSNGINCRQKKDLDVRKSVGEKQQNKYDGKNRKNIIKEASKSTRRKEI